MIGAMALITAPEALRVATLDPASKPASRSSMALSNSSGSSPFLMRL